MTLLEVDSLKAHGEQIAITGLGIYLAGCANLQDLEHILFHGLQIPESLVEQPQQALPLAGSASPAGRKDTLSEGGKPRYRAGATPRPDSNELAEMAGRLPPQDLLILQAARQAIRDSGLELTDPAIQIALLIASSSADGDSVSDSTANRLAFGETTAERLAVLWDLSATLVDLSTAEEPLIDGLKEAQSLLLSHSADAVLLGAVQIGHQHRQSDRSIRITPGAAAVVLRRRSDALGAGEHIYALLSGITASHLEMPWPNENELDAAEITDEQQQRLPQMLIEQSLQEAGNGSEGTIQVNLLELCSSLPNWPDEPAVTAVLARAYHLALTRSSQTQPAFSCALSALQASLGYLGAAAGIASLIKTALCVQRGLLPALPAWELGKSWERSPFYLPAESRSWLLDGRSQSPGQSPSRRIAGLLVAHPNYCAHLILSEATAQAVRPGPNFWLAGFHLLPISGNTLEELISNLRARKAILASHPDTGLIDLVTAGYQEHQRRPGTFTLAIVGHNHTEIIRELEFAENGLPAAFAKNGDWQTPLGSYFTASPLGNTGKVAFVYPGGFNSYPGIGKDLFYLFPFLETRFGQISSNIEDSIQGKLLYPRLQQRPSKSQLEALEAQINQNPIAMLISGTALGAIFTIILEEGFDLQPDFAFGYSLGEISMMFATGVWTQGDAMSRRLKNSPLFRTRLAGPQNAVRAYWGLPEQTNGGSPDEIWGNYLLMTSPEQVQEVLRREPKVYLTHINTPRQVVIGGDRQACQRVIAALQCPSLKAPFDYALHCPAMASEYEAIRALHHLPVEHIPAVKLYTAAHYAPLNCTSDEIADHIALGLTHNLDFPRLINQVYAAGARIFIELGAGSNCAKWIDETLKERPHLAASINRRGVDDAMSIVRLLAKCCSHKVKLDLSRLYR